MITNEQMGAALQNLDDWLELRRGSLTPGAWEALRQELQPQLEQLLRAVAAADLETVKTLLAALAERFAIRGIAVTAESAAAWRRPEPVTVTRDGRRVVASGGNATRGDGVFRSAGDPRLGGVVQRLRQAFAPAAAPISTYPSVAAPAAVPLLAAFAVEVSAHPRPLTEGAPALVLPRTQDTPVDLEVSLHLPPGCGLEAQGVTEAVLRILPDGRAARLSF